MSLAKLSSCVLALVGCMPSYTYEQRPLPEATASQQAACYRAKRLALVRGDAEWREQYSSGNYVVTETWGSAGVAFYRGEKLIRAKEAIASLPDPGLRGGYEDTLGATAGSHAAYPFWRNLSFGLAFGGLGLVVGALAVVVGDPESDLVIPLSFGGAAVAVSSIIPALLAYKHHKRAIRHDIDSHVFRQGAWAARAVSAAETYNKQIAAECGATALPLPMTPSVRGLLGVPAAEAAPPPP